jgi:hypothetical protein
MAHIVKRADYGVVIVPFEALVLPPMTHRGKGLGRPDERWHCNHETRYEQGYSWVTRTLSRDRLIPKVIIIFSNGIGSEGALEFGLTAALEFSSW